MLEFKKKEILTLYFYLSDIKNLPDSLDCVLNKLENEIFDSFTVSEIEDYRKLYNDKGGI